MTADPTLPARLAALGFVPGPGCWVTTENGPSGSVVTTEDGLVAIRVPGRAGLLLSRSWEAHIEDPTTYDAAVRFVAGLLAGHGQAVWAAFAPVDYTNREALNMLVTADKVRHDDTYAKRLRLAALHLVGLAQAVAWAEDIATRGEG